MIALTKIQLPVIKKINDYLINNLGFDKYSKFKLENSSAIARPKKIEDFLRPCSIIFFQKISRLIPLRGITELLLKIKSETMLNV